MRKTTLNGNAIPYHHTTDQLISKLQSADMQQFSLACEALSCKDDAEAFYALKKHLCNPDRFRRRYILEVIFRHPMSVSLQTQVEDFLQSEDLLLISTLLSSIQDHAIPIPEELLWQTLTKHRQALYASHFLLLKRLAVTEKNFERIKALFLSPDFTASAAACIAEALCGYAALSPEHFEEIFQMLCGSPHDHIRKLSGT